MTGNGGDVTDAWTNAEIVRAVIALTQAVKDLTEQIAGLGSEYVRKEVYELREVAVERRLDILGTAHADLDASVTRQQRDHATSLADSQKRQQATWMAWVPLIVGIVLSSGLAALITIALHK